MKSVRLDRQLEEKLERAADRLGVSQSELARDAIARRCDEVLSGSLAERLAPVIGIIESEGGRAADTGTAFRKALTRQKRT